MNLCKSFDGFKAVDHLSLDIIKMQLKNNFELNKIIQKFKGVLA